MTLSSHDIQRLAAWLAATDINRLELVQASGTLRLERRGTVIEISEADSHADAASRSLTISAPSPGIFLPRHPLHVTRLAEVGAEVHAGQIVGLLRVGALLSPVRAPCAGVIEGYWAADGAIVGYGTPLIELQAVEAGS